MRYIEWVEAVLRAILTEPTGPYRFGMAQIGERLGLEVGSWGDEPHRDLHLAISDAIDDLDSLGLLQATDVWNVAAIPEARRYRTHSLSELWPGLRAGHLDPPEETYLAKLAELSEIDHDGWAEVRRVDSREVFAALGWEWDRSRSVDISAALRDGAFAHVRSTNDSDRPRLTLAGAVRVYDEPTSILTEAREHLALNHLRAAGCIAGVELERRLKALALAKVGPLTKDPGISAYNQALQGSYPTATWRRIQVLGDLRNRCAHVLDVEPTVDDVRDLIDGVDAILRQLPAP